MRFKKAALETAFLFGLLCWLYVIAMQITNPESIYWPLTIWIPIRMDYFGEASFVIALISFFILRLKLK